MKCQFSRIPAKKPAWRPKRDDACVLCHTALNKLNRSDKKMWSRQLCITCAATKQDKEKL